ncbi:MAG: hypothetical protein HUU16_08375 [Candidatus Omnitrophica bacterium]|nr:hypothetical protein [Candidatus Omnitrophota bacterium]
METILEVARKLAEHHARIEPSIRRIFLFPDTDEIRLVEVDQDTSPTEGDEIHPWYFNPDPETGVFFPSGVAVITPDECLRLSPPATWGTWKDAVEIWPTIIPHG